MKYIKVKNQNHAEVTREAALDKWDRDDTFTYHNINGIELSDEYGDIPVPDDFRISGPMYLVYVIYSTGDSFGYDSHAGEEYIGVYKDREIAQETANKIKEDYKNNKEDFNHITLLDSVGNEFQQYTGAWKGYFDNLEYVEVVMV